MQKLFKLIDNLKTQLAIDEEENEGLERKINSYTSVGDEEDELDKQVSHFEGEAGRVAHSEHEECFDDERNEQVSTCWCFKMQPNYKSNKSQTFFPSPLEIET